MSDYRHDIYGPKGLSQLSGLYTVKSHALESVNDDEIKADTLKGKNLIHNGKPIISETEGADLSWHYARSVGGDLHFVPGEYIDISMVSTTTGTSALTQIEKAYKHAGELYNRTDEFKNLIPLSKMTISYEVKSTIPFKLISRFNTTDANNTRLLRIFDFTESYTEPVAEWTKVSITDVIPEDFEAIFFGENAYTSRFYIQTDLVDRSVGQTGHIYIRNIQMEYGDTATEYTMSDWDKDYMIENPIIPDPAPAYQITFDPSNEVLKYKNVNDPNSTFTEVTVGELKEAMTAANQSNFLLTSEVTGTGVQARWGDSVTPDTATLYYRAYTPWSITDPVDIGMVLYTITSTKTDEGWGPNTITYQEYRSDNS